MGYKYATNIFLSLTHKFCRTILRSIKSPALVARNTNFNGCRAKAGAKIFRCSFLLSMLESLLRTCSYPHKMASQKGRKTKFLLKPLSFRLKSHTTILKHHSLTIYILLLNNVYQHWAFLILKLNLASQSHFLICEK